MYFILFFGTVLIVAFVLMKVTQKGKTEKYEEFRRAVKAGAVSVVPKTAGFEMVMAQGAKDAVSTVKGYERIQTGYESLPSFIVCYKEDEMYIMAVQYPSRTAMEPDTDFIMHITKDMLQEVKFGAMGKVAFYFKNSKQFFVMTVTDFAISLVMQPEESKLFKTYIKEFAERVNSGK